MKSIKSLVLFSHLFLGFSFTVTSADNPKTCALPIGCKCLVSAESVSCNLGITDTTLHTSFDLIKEKRIVDTFDLSENSNVTKIVDYFSRNVSFVNIHIRDVKSLTTIEENAFWSSVNTTKSFRLTSSSVNSSQSLFKAISKLVYLTELDLTDNQLKTIPDHAFGENQKHLTLVVLSGNQIRHLGEYAFFGLNFLNYLDLSNNLLDKLGNNSFAINKTKDSDYVQIRISLKSNQIKEISEQAFDKLSRPTNFDISFNNLTQLRANVFKPILKFESTKVIVKGNKVKCDCGIKWIYDNKLIKQKFSGPIRCADKIYFNELTQEHFKNCTNTYELDE